MMRSALAFGWFFLQASNVLAAGPALTDGPFAKPELREKRDMRGDEGSSTGSTAATTSEPSTVEQIPRLGLVTSAHGLSRGKLFAGSSVSSTYQDSSTDAQLGFDLGGSPLERLTIYGSIARHREQRYAPELAIQYRILGASLVDAIELAGMTRYKAEGFAEAEGEVEVGFSSTFRFSPFVSDVNLVFGLGAEEEEVGEADGELRARAAFVAADCMRFGLEGAARKRLAGERSLAGGRTWDIQGGPSFAYWNGPLVLAVTGGASTVEVPDGIAAFGLLNVAATTW